MVEYEHSYTRVSIRTGIRLFVLVLVLVVVALALVSA